MIASGDLVLEGRFLRATRLALFQVGAFYELYDRRDAPIAKTLGLKPLKENRRRALYGIPERLFGRYLARLLGLDRSVAVVR